QQQRVSCREDSVVSSPILHRSCSLDSLSTIPPSRVSVRPVERMSWDQIQAFESATGLRLPTEAEWEFACRAGTQTRYSNGSNDPESVEAIAWFEGNSNASTRFDGQKAANPLGFHDMRGNVSE
ncbi:MAG: formylglycine-generating enzyme family protein, partial [Phycisphaerales bacterium]